MKAGRLFAGVAAVEITPRAPQFLAGYSARNHPSTGVHDPLNLRALYLKDACGTDAAVVSADILWFGKWMAPRIRELVEGELGIPHELLLLFCVHDHSAPGFRDTPEFREWMEMVAGKALAAIALAKSRAVPASLSLARGISRIGTNRRQRLDDGRIILGRNPGGPIDREIVALAVRAGRKPVAFMANFACHGVILGQENYLVSGDWPGNASRLVQERTGAPLLILNGGCGNVNSRIGPQNSFGPVNLLAREFARDFRRTIRRAAALSGGSIAGREKAIRLPAKKGKKALMVVLKGLRAGPLIILGYPGEMFSETAMAVKAAFPGRAVMACSYAEESLSGYIPVREAYPEGGYEVDSSPYAPGGEAVLRRELIALGRSLLR
jgi:hypothetical protein